MQNYVTQAKGDAPANNTRARRSITTEIMLATLEVSQTHARPHQLASRKFPTQLFVEIANAVLDSTTGNLLEYRHLLKNPKYNKIWSNAMGKEVGRLAQGLDEVVDGTNTIDFIAKHDIPQDRW